MVTGLSKAYRCRACGTLFLRSRNGRVIALEEEDSGLGGGRPPTLTTRLKNILGLPTCPHCGSLKVAADPTIKT